MRKARKGTKIVYVPGNHDEAGRDFLRDWPRGAIALGDNITICEETVHTTADGRRFLVLHGDRCDSLVHLRSDLSYAMKSAIYRLYQAFNRGIKIVRRVAGLPYWSLAAEVNNSTQFAKEMIAAYEERLAAEARETGYDGVICGHIHHAAVRTIRGVTYCNDGDWVDSCTALVEHFDGRLEACSPLQSPQRTPRLDWERVLQVLRWLDHSAEFAGVKKRREKRAEDAALTSGGHER